MKKLHKIFHSLLYSWGGDTPPEAIWSANDFLDYFKPNHPELKGLEFLEDDDNGENNRILEIIKTLDI